MGKVNYYITSNGILKRKQNTVYFIKKNEKGELEKKILPINKIYAIFAHGRITFSSAVVSYLSKHGVPIHFFNKYGFYEGSLYPRETLVSGDLLVKQVEYYLNKEKRVELARKIVEGSIENIIKNLQYYERTKGELQEEIRKIESLLKELERQNEIQQLMAVEGNVRDTYYQSFNKIFPEKFHFDKRSRRPPENMINCLISFGNSLVYSTVLTEIYNTQLNPTISYLHEPFERRFSLALDLSEIFKPLLADRVIFKLINKGIIEEKHFIKELNYILLNDDGKKLFLQHYDEKLKTIIKHRDLGRSVSFQRLIRLECYKLMKHLLGIKEYEPFVIWW
ncbi:MAG: type I-B CRISPR-associated endonuclease Cas1b [Candidatus Aenigmatarchaeota archaeon]